jgi:hypothetical protein
VQERVVITRCSGGGYGRGDAMLHTPAGFVQRMQGAIVKGKDHGGGCG